MITFSYHPALSEEIAEITVTCTAPTKTFNLAGIQTANVIIIYLQDNIRTLRKFFLSTDGKISLIEPDGTYLMWLDCRNLRLSDPELKTFFMERAHVWLHSVTTFGAGGSGFVRMNIACPKSVSETAQARIDQALK